jgi:hypothetical protein
MLFAALPLEIQLHIFNFVDLDTLVRLKEASDPYFATPLEFLDERLMRSTLGLIYIFFRDSPLMPFITGARGIPEGKKDQEDKEEDTEKDEAEKGSENKEKYEDGVGNDKVEG